MGIVIKRGEKMPLISVIMGIYNCADTLEEAIDSIVKQSIDDWELILCDDGSEDETYAVAKKFELLYPQKVIILQNNKNMGLNYSLNKCLAVAQGKYIARMDGDDRCSRLRFEKEVQLLNDEPEIDIVSTDMTFFDESGTWGLIQHPEKPDYRDFLYESPFCHAPCMVRKEAFDAVGGYTDDQKILRVEDYHLWIKMYAAGYKGRNIHEPLYEMRDDRNAYARRKFKYRINEAYVKALAVKKLNLPWYGYIFAFRPILVGILPKGIYDRLHKRRLKE